MNRVTSCDILPNNVSRERWNAYSIKKLNSGKTDCKAAGQSYKQL